MSHDLGPRLRRWRHAAGFGALLPAARKADVAAGYLHDLERGNKQNPSLLILERLAAAYGCTVGALLTEDPTHD